MPEAARGPEPFELTVNGEKRVVEVAGDTPLLWVLREQLGLTGTKFGCGEQLCGACTVLIDGVAERACGWEVSDAVGSAILTIEGLASGKGLHPVQRAWLEKNVPQCGYCQPGQILAAVALLAESPKPSEREIDLALEGNLCRCGTYPRIRQGIHRAAELLAEGKGS